MSLSNPGLRRLESARSSLQDLDHPTAPETQHQPCKVCVTVTAAVRTIAVIASRTLHVMAYQPPEVLGELQQQAGRSCPETVAVSGWCPTTEALWPVKAPEMTWVS